MDNAIILIQITLDAVALFLCCNGIFQKDAFKKKKDLLLLPLIMLIFIMARVSWVVGDYSSALLDPQGFEVVPANNVYLLIIQVFSVMTVNSIYYKPTDNGFTFCGTMAAFSIYLLTRTVGIVAFSFFDAGGNLFHFGSRLLAIALIVFLLCAPVFERIRESIADGGFAARLVSVNIAAVFIVIMSMLSFDMAQFLDNLWIIIAILMLLLLMDSGLLYYNQKKIQERKHIQMIEQYVPIVEELISQVRARQHEFNNRIFAIDAAVNAAGSLDEAKEAVSVLTKDVMLHPNDRELLACDSKVIAGMLYGKLKQAEFSGIVISVELHGLFKKSATPETEWIEVIGILLDNAIEASSSGDTVYLSSKSNEKYLELTVSNPSAPMSNSEFMRLFNKGVTSKADKHTHGFGLYNLLRIVERHHGKILTRNEQIGQENHVVFGVILP